MVRGIRRTCAIFALVTCAVVFCGQALAVGECAADKNIDPGSMAADTVLARPVGAAATLTGFAIFLISSPFSILGDNTQEAWDSLVTAPAQYTFKRPLGHFDCQAAVGSEQK